MVREDGTKNDISIFLNLFFCFFFFWFTRLFYFILFGCFFSVAGFDEQATNINKQADKTPYFTSFFISSPYFL